MATSELAGSDATDVGGRPERDGLRWWRELVYIALFYFVYSQVRNLFGSQGTEDVDPTVAFEHALQVIDIQRALGLYFEADLQRWYLDLPARGLIRVWNVFYGLAHFVVTAAALAWMFRRDRRRYPFWRNTLAATTAIALIGYASYSLMPPRLLDDHGIYGGCPVYAPEVGPETDDDVAAQTCDRYGFTDTVAVYGGWISFGDERAASLTNQYAAMPSMHIGWAVWSSMVLGALVRRRWVRVVVWAYPVITLFTIMVTGNHFWLDAVGGLAALAVGLALGHWLTRWSGRWTEVVRRRRKPQTSGTLDL